MRVEIEGNHWQSGFSALFWPSFLWHQAGLRVPRVPIFPASPGKWSSFFWPSCGPLIDPLCACRGNLFFRTTQAVPLTPGPAADAGGASPPHTGPLSLLSDPFELLSNYFYSWVPPTKNWRKRRYYSDSTFNRGANLVRCANLVHLSDGLGARRSTADCGASMAGDVSDVSGELGETSRGLLVPRCGVCCSKRATRRRACP